VRAVVLNAFAEFPANGAGSGFGGVGGAHGIAPFCDAGISFEGDDDSFAAAHKVGEFAEERAGFVNGVETFGLRFGEADGFDGDDVKFCGVDAAENIGRESALDCVGLDDCESPFDCHSMFLLFRE
jgi:hypothetical protein